VDFGNRQERKHLPAKIWQFHISDCRFQIADFQIAGFRFHRQPAIPILQSEFCNLKSEIYNLKSVPGSELPLEFRQLAAEFGKFGAEREDFALEICDSVFQGISCRPRRSYR